MEVGRDYFGKYSAEIYVERAQRIIQQHNSSQVEDYNPSKNVFVLKEVYATAPLTDLTSEKKYEEDFFFEKHHHIRIANTVKKPISIVSIEYLSSFTATLPVLAIPICPQCQPVQTTRSSIQIPGETESYQG